MATNVNFADDYLTCTMCFELYNHKERQPKGLPCLHNFCMECMERYIQKNPAIKQPCPVCRVKFIVPEEGVRGIPTNVMLKGMLDLQRADTKSDISEVTGAHKQEVWVQSDMLKNFFFY